jgi:hypothetical protein
MGNTYQHQINELESHVLVARNQTTHFVEDSTVSEAFSTLYRGPTRNSVQVTGLGPNRKLTII